MNIGSGLDTKHLVEKGILKPDTDNRYSGSQPVRLLDRSMR